MCLSCFRILIINLIIIFYLLYSELSSTNNSDLASYLEPNHAALALSCYVRLATCLDALTATRLGAALRQTRAGCAAGGGCPGCPPPPPPAPPPHGLSLHYSVCRSSAAAPGSSHHRAVSHFQEPIASNYFRWLMEVVTLGS